ncbi:hypothetical protein FKP32DRAFT_655205 [Trametes sanguinea]|nr:hypothetical protein FKP32DRAFT_655205 [Trametes sanguinea]
MDALQPRLCASVILGGLGVGFGAQEAGWLLDSGALCAKTRDLSYRAVPPLAVFCRVLASRRIKNVFVLPIARTLRCLIEHAPRGKGLDSPQRRRTATGAPVLGPFLVSASRHPRHKVTAEGRRRSSAGFALVAPAAEHPLLFRVSRRIARN